ncbi:MAG: hypothetical protein RJQ00_05490 [Vicingaceae bacterium]
MKRIIYSATFLIITFLALAATNSESCDTKALKKQGIAELNPYFYSAAKVNTISYDYKETRKEIEVPLFKGEKYKMVFNKKALPKDVVIEVYDKDKENTNRSPIFSSADSTGTLVTFEPKKSKKMYVNYVIPEAGDVKETGCLVFILGYQLTFLKD